MMSADLLHEFQSSLISYFNSKDVAIHDRSFKLTRDHILGDMIICSRYFEHGIDEDTILALRSHIWPLPVSDIGWQKYRLFLSFDRVKVFKLGLKSFYSFHSVWYPNTYQAETSDLQCNMEPLLDGLTYRVELLADVAKNLLRVASQIRFQDNKSKKPYRFTNESIGKNDDESKRIIRCGNVHCRGDDFPTNNITPQKYLRILKGLVIQKMNDRNKTDDEIAAILTDAILKFEILRVKPSSSVNLKLTAVSVNESFSDAVIFIQYNYSRLNAIIHEFESRVTKNIYLPLPSIEFADFSLLKDEKEWTLMFNFILQFPSVILKSVELTSEKNPSSHVLCNYLYSLARNISSYYRSVKILLETKPNLMPLVHVRMHLVRAIHKIIYISLRLLNIRVVAAL